MCFAISNNKGDVILVVFFMYDELEPWLVWARVGFCNFFNVLPYISLIMGNHCNFSQPKSGFDKIIQCAPGVFDFRSEIPRIESQ